MKSLLFLLLPLALLSCQSSAKQSVELGTITYEKTLEEALAKSEKSKKPVFLLFQEVPG